MWFGLKTAKRLRKLGQVVEKGKHLFGVFEFCHQRFDAFREVGVLRKIIQKDENKYFHTILYAKVAKNAFAEYNGTIKDKEMRVKSFKDYKAPDCTKADEQDTVTAETLTKKIAQAYHGKSNADMLRNILAEAEKGKRAGTLSNEEIESFYQAFSPMLDGFQRKRLRAIVDKLKAIE